MDLKYLTKEGSWEKNPLIYRRRFCRESVAGFW